MNDFNINNGLLTKIWGPSAWFFLSSVAFGYPINPTDIDKEKYKNFFMSFGCVLPCCFCRDSCSKFILEGDTIINDEVFLNRENLTKWVFKLHNRVNKKLSVDYGTTYEEYCDKFESFRARCIENTPDCEMPLELKAISYFKANEKECNIIPLELALKFKNYAKLRNINMDQLEYYNDILTNKRNSDEFKNRNLECNNIINHMKLNAIPSIEQNGEYKNKLSIDELKLISMLCTSLSIKELEELYYKKKYKLVS